MKEIGEWVSPTLVEEECLKLEDRQVHDIIRRGEMSDNVMKQIPICFLLLVGNYGSNCCFKIITFT